MIIFWALTFVIACAIIYAMIVGKDYFEDK